MNVTHISNMGSGIISVVNGSTNEIVSKISTGHVPLGVAVNHNTDAVYMSSTVDV